MALSGIMVGDEASMRPPEFTGGNIASPAAGWPAGTIASMRPPEFTGGNSLGLFRDLKHAAALQ